MAQDPWDWVKFAKGPFEPRNYGKVAVYITCIIVILLVLSGARSLWTAFFPPPPQGSTSNIGRVEAGGVVKNITIQSPKLKQGIYGSVSSNDFGVGVFKEVMPNIDVSLGVEKEFDTEEIEVEVEARFKF